MTDHSMSDDRRTRGARSDRTIRNASSDDMELFDAHIGLADRLARRYSFGQGTDDDMRQVAHLGLLLACRRYDPDQGVFVRFATVTIVGELKKHLRSNGWGVRVPRSLQEDSITVSAANERLTARLGRTPTVSEVGEHTGFATDRIVEAVRVREARFATSIEHANVDVVGNSTPEEAAIMAHTISGLDDDQRRLIRLRFSDGLSQSEIGRLIGISQPQVHRRLTRAVEALRTALEDAPT